MKKFIPLALFPLMALFLGFKAQDSFSGKPKTKRTPLPIGSIIPKANVKLQTYGKNKASMQQAGRKNGLLVIFSANTCTAVVQNQFRLVDVCNFALGNKVGVMVINPNEGNRDGSDSREAMRTYAEVQGFRWFYTMDQNNEMANAFGATSTPECFLFDHLGRLVYRGAIDDSPKDEKLVKRAHLKEAITAIANRKKVTLSETTAQGCPIRRK